LTKYGDEVDARNADGRTPLYFSIRQKLFDTLRVLLEFGSDPWAVTKVGASAIDIAIKNGLVDILRFLGNASRTKVRSLHAYQRDLC
jgi:ankyrin repeat protein